MLNKSFKNSICVVAFTLAGVAISQEIEWYSIDQGGGTSSAANISVSGVLGQVEFERLEGGSVTVASGYYPLPAELIFEDRFE